MLAENTLPIVERRLMLAARLTVEAFAQERQQAIEFCESNKLTKPLDEQSIQALQRLRCFSLAAEEHYRAVMVCYCYADIPAFRQYSVLYDANDHSKRVSTKAILQFSIFYNRLPQLTLEHGHHQLAVFYFPEGVSSLLDELPTSIGETIQQTLLLADVFP